MIIQVHSIFNQVKKATDSTKKTETFQEILDHIGTPVKLLIELISISLNAAKMTQNQVNYIKQLFYKI